MFARAGRSMAMGQGPLGVRDAADGGHEVADAEGLARTVSALLADPARLRLMARNAALAMERNGGATARTMAAIEPLLPAGVS